MHHKLAVSNVKCEGCASNIRTALSGVGQVENVAVDIGGGTVEFDAEEAALPAVTSALAQAGYPVGKAARRGGLLGLFGARG